MPVVEAVEGMPVVEAVEKVDKACPMIWAGPDVNFRLDGL
jgi:hypothetical protein